MKGFLPTEILKDLKLEIKYSNFNKIGNGSKGWYYHVQYTVRLDSTTCTL